MPEPVGVAFVGGGEGRRSLGADLGSGAEVHGRGGVQPDAAVAVLVVVVAEELVAESAGVLNGAESVGEGRAVLQRLERGLAVGVVVADLGAAVAAYDAEVGQQQRD